MPTSTTATSTPRLSEVARHVVVPAGIVTTAWPRIVAKCHDLGVEFDEWQHGIGSIALGKREDGMYAATVGGVVLSIPRQVGKTFLVGMMAVAMCLLFPGLTVLWTAHRTRTSNETFAKMKALTDRPQVKPFMLRARNVNGEQEIRFRNGSRIMFGAREQGFGRGFDEVDVEVFDEAQILTEKALEDMVPAANQSRQPSGALLFFMGTPPRPTDPGEEFTRRREAALSGESEDMVYVEFSADSGARLDDHAQWAKANPSFPRRTPVESMKRMRAQLTDDDSFRREGLGIWPENKDGDISPQAWATLADGRSVAPDAIAVAFDVAIDRSIGSIALYGKRADGLGHLELVESRPGVDWMVPRLIEIAGRNTLTAPLCCESRGPAGGLVPDLTEAGVDVLAASAVQVNQACASFLDGIDVQQFRHTGQPQLTAQVLRARKQTSGDAWRWTRKEADVSGLYAVTLARWAFMTRELPEPPKPPANIF